MIKYILIHNPVFYLLNGSLEAAGFISCDCAKYYVQYELALVL